MRAGRLAPLLIAAALVLPMVATTGARAQSLQELQQRLEEAKEQRASVEERLAAAAAELDALEVRIAELEEEREELSRERQHLERTLDELGAVISFRVRETYKHGSNLDPITVFLASDDPERALSRAQTVQRLVAGDQVRTDEVAAARTRLLAVDERLAEREAELEEAEARQQEVAAQLREDLAEAQQLEQRLTEQERQERERIERERRERERRERERRERERRERAAAQRAASSSGSSASSGSSGSSTANVSSGGMACPLDQPRHFTDTWGAPRSGGRAHRGTDILGPYGIPVRAITSGTWTIQRPGPSAGNWGILRGGDGNHYWYLHLQSHTVSSGTRVSAGQQVATNGDTGNARGTPHVHFELHPGGGSAVNPYSLLRSVC